MLTALATLTMIDDALVCWHCYAAAVEHVLIQQYVMTIFGGFSFSNV